MGIAAKLASSFSKTNSIRFSSSKMREDSKFGTCTVSSLSQRCIDLMKKVTLNGMIHNQTLEDQLQREVLQGIIKVLKDRQEL